jgi:glucosamine--fructose-6-phosphate aminotransferase (isomerizing)
MCGIVGAVAERDVVPILIAGLRNLEYRGYDSAGVVVLDEATRLTRARTAGKVQALADLVQQQTLHGYTGVAHTRWATHGKPETRNAHPHICRNTVALVHNGIIENHEALRAKQRAKGYEFTSDTDTETVVHEIYDHLMQDKNLLRAVQDTLATLEGAYAFGVISKTEPGRLIAARRGSPLVIGIGIGEHFIASQSAALLPVTQRFIYLEDGDVADITRDGVAIYDAHGNTVNRPIHVSTLTPDAVDKGPYRHYMLKEIFEQPQAIADTLTGALSDSRVLEEAFGPNAKEVFDTVEAVQIIACGTSFHAASVARYWLESLAGIACTTEVASEFRYRNAVLRKNSLIVCISQSGETADTLAALHEAKRRGFGRAVAICNVAESALVRASDSVFLTRAGPEIGVASTKAFTTQLVALLLLTICLGRRRGMSQETEASLVKQLVALPRHIDEVLQLNDTIRLLAERFAEKHHALFLGRGTQYPVAMEGALKLKEISYIHAEAYPAGELKHGPLALVDADMPVIAVAPNNDLLEKLKSNLQEVRARGGELYVFADAAVDVAADESVHVIPIAPTDDVLAPIIFTIPLQLLAYHVAVLKGTDVDQPRNLAKSVTVE